MQTLQKEDACIESPILEDDEEIKESPNAAAQALIG